MEFTVLCAREISFFHAMCVSWKYCLEQSLCVGLFVWALTLSNDGLRINRGTNQGNELMQFHHLFETVHKVNIKIHWYKVWTITLCRLWHYLMMDYASIKELSKEMNWCNSTTCLRQYTRQTCKFIGTRCPDLPNMNLWAWDKNCWYLTLTFYLHQKSKFNVPILKTWFDKIEPVFEDGCIELWLWSAHFFD